MHLLSTKGRGALLNFLRNLTPQVLLISVGLLLYIKWTNTNSITYISLSVCTFIVAAMAFFANFEEFLAGAFSQSEAIATHLELVKQDEPSILKRIWILLGYIFKEKPISLLELIFAFIITYIAVIAVLFTSIFAVAKTFV